MLFLYLIIVSTFLAYLNFTQACKSPGAPSAGGNFPEHDTGNRDGAPISLPIPAPEARLRFTRDPVARLFGSFLKLFISDPDVLRVSRKTLAGLFYIYTALSIAGSFGMDTKAILSLLSISGLTLGLAIQTILGHTFSGFFLVFFCPFKRGWTITVDQYTGKVLSIDTRYVKLLSKNRAELLLPSHLVYSKPIIVESKNAIN